MDNSPLLERVNIFYQQDDAPLHNTRNVMDLSNVNFGNTWIGTNGPVKWPLSSPTLSPTDFSFRGHIKSKLCKRHNDNINELRQNFEDYMNSISNNQSINL